MSVCIVSGIQILMILFISKLHVQLMLSSSPLAIFLLWSGYKHETLQAQLINEFRVVAMQISSRA